MSRDGRVVAFTSSDPNLVPAVFPQCTASCPTQIYRVDRDLDENGRFDEPGRTDDAPSSARWPVARPPVAGTAASFAPTMSADGHLIAFVTKATNLQLIQAAVGGAATDGDLLIADASTGVLTPADRVGRRRPPGRCCARSPASQRHGPHGRVRHAGRRGTDRHRSHRPDAPSWRCRARRACRSPRPTSAPRWSASPATSGTSSVINDGSSSFMPAPDHGQRRPVQRSTRTRAPVHSACPCRPAATARSALTFTPSSPGPVSATLTVAEAGYQAASISTRVRGCRRRPDAADHARRQGSRAPSPSVRRARSSSST